MGKGFKFDFEIMCWVFRLLWGDGRLRPFLCASVHLHLQKSTPKATNGARFRGATTEWHSTLRASAAWSSQRDRSDASVLVQVNCLKPKPVGDEWQREPLTVAGDKSTPKYEGELPKLDFGLNFQAGLSCSVRVNSTKIR